MAQPGADAEGRQRDQEARQGRGRAGPLREGPDGAGLATGLQDAVAEDHQPLRDQQAGHAGEASQGQSGHQQAAAEAEHRAALDRAGQAMPAQPAAAQQGTQHIDRRAGAQHQAIALARDLQEADEDKPMYSALI
eukprot:Opistho-2@69664